MKRLPEILAFTALAGVLGLAVALQGNAGDRTGSDTNAASEAPGNSFAIRDARVFDGEGDIGIATVVVREGLIESVGADVAVPEGLPVVEGAGRTLLPGLIDAHVHAWGDARRDAVRFGVTTAFDMHGMVDRLPQLRQQRESVTDTGQADLWASGYAITAPGGHGTQYGFPLPAIDADTNVEAFIGERLDEGVDFIKLIVEDMSAYPGAPSLPTLTPEQVTAVIGAAHAADRLAVVHASTLRDSRHAIEAGANGLVHIFADQPVDQGFIDAALKGDAFVVPTLAVLASFAAAGEGAALAADPHLGPMLTAEQRATLGTVIPGVPPNDRLEQSLASVRALHAAGVTILAGTDAPNPGTAHGVSMHGELELLVRAGLEPTQALAAATALPARHFGIGDRGRIVPGMRADLLLVDGDPLADITATRAIVGVWKNGYRIERDPSAGAPAAQAAPDQTLVSDFDAGSVSAAFGSWQPTTDQMAGGASTVGHRLVADGANGSSGALEVTGEIRPGFPFPWAGMMFFPAAEPMQPVDLSARGELVFQVRGDGRSYNAMLFSGPSVQGMPATLTFQAGPEWTEVRLALSDFPGADLSLVRGIAFTAGHPAGSFEFFLDDVELR
ncbi:CIA30 family protein [Luteimonas qiangzhengi]|uniref:CIA30 family protein n=1 Tax=Luteimonas sp. MJ146 TaxID=3129240 RepID=UPI0031BB7C73